MYRGENLSDISIIAIILDKRNNPRLQNLCDASGSFVDSKEKTLELHLDANFTDFNREGKTVTHNNITEMQISKNRKVAVQILTPDKVK